MQVLITGANGFLAQHLCLYLASKNFDVIAVSRNKCRIPAAQKFQYFSTDLSSETQVQQLFQQLKPDVVIHTAAMSKPDECNNNKEECIKQNVLATKYLLEASKPFKPFFIYTSTDFVFGENGPHTENDQTSPLNFYGESKLQAEKLVENSGLDYAIVRPVFIYGKIWEGLRGSFLHWVKNNLDQGKKIKVVSDQQRTPTYAEDICKGIETIMNKGFQGIYHLAGNDILSPYEMAVAVAKVLQLDEALIEKVTSENFPEPVKRAKKSGLKIDKAIKDLNYDPVSFEEGVRLTFDLDSH